MCWRPEVAGLSRRTWFENRAYSSSGIFLFGVDNNNLVGNDVNDSMSIVDSSKNTIVNNTASDNFGGIFVGGFRSVSQNNQIHANTTNNNTLSFGLDLGVGATNNNITGNKSFGNDPFDMQDEQLLQLRLLGFGFLQDGDVGIRGASFHRVRKSW
jgi:parallel beta-helix repeat protein